MVKGMETRKTPCMANNLPDGKWFDGFPKQHKVLSMRRPFVVETIVRNIFDEAEVRDNKHYNIYTTNNVCLDVTVNTIILFHSYLHSFITFTISLKNYHIFKNQ